MFSHADDLYARTIFEDMLREAAEHRRFAHYASQQPGVFDRALAALKSAFASKRPQSAAREAQAPATRKRLAAE